jgi:hypothetical protein
MRNVLSTSTKLLAATAGIAAMLAMATPAQAAPNGHNSLAWQIQHFFDCKVLLLTNPALHAKLCLPGHINFTFLASTTHFTDAERCEWEKYAKPE